MGEEPTVKCIICGEQVSVENARPGPGYYPVHIDCSFDPTETPEGGRHI